MNYYGEYGLEFNPFLKNSKDILINTSEFKEISHRLDFLLQSKGFGVITGQPGRGKTTAVRNWANSLNKAKYKVIYVSLSTVTVLEFYRNLASELGLEPKFKKNENFRIIQSEINRMAIDKKITPVIILDEANYISSAILNDLKIMFNFEMDSRDRAVVLLVGLPQLNSTLRLTHHEPLRQRIIVNYHMEELSSEESRKYLEEKIRSAGGSLDAIAENSAIEAVINVGSGNPRVMNRIFDNALKIASLRKDRVINAETVMMAVDEMQLS